MFKKVNPKQNFPEMERDLMQFWKENKIFEESVSRDGKRPIYSFFDGPPFATGLPHYGNIVASLMKDAVPRFWTMKGRRVERRWGWDCHGLPIENLIEKEHGIKNKKDIEKWGVDKFNDACHASVLRYADEWKKVIPRVGRWVDMDNDYKTMDWKYTESIWWVFSELHKKKLVYEGYKSMHICPRCETSLSNFEVTQGYKEITDLSATVKFKLTKESIKILNEKILKQVQDDKFDRWGDDTYVLAWTTTPWTLPGNIALAVGKNIEYVRIEVLESQNLIFKTGENYIFSKNFFNKNIPVTPDALEEGGSLDSYKDYLTVGEKFKGAKLRVWDFDVKCLVGLEYEPVFPYLKKIINEGLPPRVLKKVNSNEAVEPQFARNRNGYDSEKWKEKMKEVGKSGEIIQIFKDNAYKVYSGGFVTTEEGTGIVHIAPAFGDEDYKLSQKENLPLVQHVKMDGTFEEDVVHHDGFLYDLLTVQKNPWQGVSVKPIDNFQETDIKIIKYLAHVGLLFSKEKIKHSYPHCWRCDTPLINYSTVSWFVKVTELKDKMIKNNKEVAWVPEYIKEGRFGKWLEDARDWAVSRSRFWGAPLPVWKCSKCRNIEVIGSVDELRKKTDKKITKIIFMRHGESGKNVDNIKSDSLDKYPLTEDGKKHAASAAQRLKDGKIDIIITSPVLRTRQTAEIIGKKLKAEVEKNDLIAEYKYGTWNDKSSKELLENDELYKNYKKITNPEGRYNYVLGGNGESRAQMEIRIRKFIDYCLEKYPGKNILVVSHGGLDGIMKRVLSGITIPEFFVAENELHYCDSDIFYVDENGKEFNLHKPNIDSIKIKCPKCEGEAEITGSVFDCWFESGSMPYAQWHYPFENEEEFKKSFPADFIAEGLDQTRGWFYTLMVLSTALFDKPAFKNVIVNGIVLAEDGQKMSKHLKNYPDPNLLIEKYGADSLRYYLLSSPVVKGENLNFSEKGVEEVLKRFIIILWNTYSFLVMNLDLAGVEKAAVSGKNKSTNLLDKWILSELNLLVEEVNKQMEGYDLVKASRPLREFMDKLSNWYVRRSRKRFGSEDKNDKNYAFQTLYEAMVTYSKLMAPFMPFLADEMYRNLTGEESVHLSEFPKAEKGNIDKELNAQMDLIRQAVTVGLSLRAANSLKVRMPLNSLKVESGKLKVADNELMNLVKDELNVKNIEFVEKIEEKKGWAVKEENGVKVALDLEVTDELKFEGLAREIVRQIQTMRKDAKYNRDDEVIIEYNFNEVNVALEKVFEKWSDYIKKECLAEKMGLAFQLPAEKFDIVRDVKAGEFTLTVGVKKSEQA